MTLALETGIHNEEKAPTASGVRVSLGDDDVAAELASEDATTDATTSADDPTAHKRPTQPTSDAVASTVSPSATATAMAPQPRRSSRRAETAVRASVSVAAVTASEAAAKPPLPPVKPPPRESSGTAASESIPGPIKRAARRAAAAAVAKPEPRPEAGAQLGGGSGAPSDLERERAELMERNRRLLQALQLPGLVAGVSATAAAEGAGGSGRRQASQRGVGAKRMREASQEPAPPRRVSLRQRGVAADRALAAGIDCETASGVQLVAGKQAVEAATGRPVGHLEEQSEKFRHPRGELPFRSDNGDEQSDAAFLAELQKAAAGAAAGAAGPTSSPGDEAAGGRTWRGARTAAAPGGEVLAKLSLAERDVAKVTKEGVTHLAWLPGSERLLLAAADKSGKVSLWDVDVAADGPAADTDGVLMFAPHAEYVSGMRWLGREAAVGPSRLITAAYDGSIRALDLGGAGTWLQLPAPGDPRDAEFSALEVTCDGRTAFLGDPLGNLDVVDLRAPPPPPRRTQDRDSGARTEQQQQQQQPGQQPGGSEGGEQARLGKEEATEPGGAAGAGAATALAAGPVGGLHLCDRKLNSLHLEPSAEHLLATSCSDGTVCVWDVRKLSSAAAAAGSGGGGGRETDDGRGRVKALGVLRHGKSCHAAYWAADGSKRLLSTSYDDTIRIWADPAAGAAADGTHMTQVVSIPHNNQTGRWVTPFRAVWGASWDAVLVGNMRRGLDVFAVPRTAGDLQDERGVGKGGKLLTTLTSEAMTAIPSRAACHPTLPVVVAATSSGRCHVWR